MGESAMGEPVHRRSVLAAAVAHAVVLTLGSVGYGYHRDELYFRMLPPRWSYFDQPPLTPFLARLTTHVADQPWALRLPATLASAVAVVLVGVLTARLGGGRRAQQLAVWGYAFGVFPLMLGHLLLTSTIDLPLLLGLVILVLDAVSGRPRAWIAAGALAGFTASNRLLVVAVLASLVAGLLVLGPRGSLRTRWPWLGAATALLVAAPQIGYQATHHWPQLQMGKALSENNSGEVRLMMPLMLLVMLGPPLVVIWAAGIGWLLRSPQRARFGFLAVAFGLFLVFAFVTGAQPHYPLHLLTVMYAAGCVPTGNRLGLKRIAWSGIAINGAVALIMALPVIPTRWLGDTPIPGISQLVADQVGWPRYVRQIGDAYARAGGDADILASNYGEAGALARYGPASGLPAPVSGHNALADLTRPSRDRVLVVGGQLKSLRPLFAQCRDLGRLDNGVGVDNEEQDQPIALCTGPSEPWPTLWLRVRHLD